MPPDVEARTGRPARLVGACRRLVFHHIPKTAGTSLHHALVKNFAPEEVCPDRFATLTQYRYDQLAKFRFFSGHFDKYNIDLIPSPKRVITFVREPKARIISWYNFLRAADDSLTKNPKQRGVILAKSLTLLEFLRCEERAIRMGIDNTMARTFLGRGQLLGYPVTKASSATMIANWAFTNVRRYSFVGVVERSEQDFAALFELLGLKYEPSDMRKNIGPSAAPRGADGDGDPEIERELDRLTAIDRILYERILAHGGGMMCPYPL